MIEDKSGIAIVAGIFLEQLETNVFDSEVAIATIVARGYARQGAAGKLTMMSDAWHNLRRQRQARWDRPPDVPRLTLALRICRA